MKINGNLELNDDGSGKIVNLFVESFADVTTDLTNPADLRIVYNEATNGLVISNNGTWKALGVSHLYDLLDVDKASVLYMNAGSGSDSNPMVNGNTGNILTVTNNNASGSKWSSTPVMFVYDSQYEVNNGYDSASNTLAGPQSSYTINHNLNTINPIICVSDTVTGNTIVPQNINVSDVNSAVVTFSTARHCKVSIFSINTLSTKVAAITLAWDTSFNGSGSYNTSNSDYANMDNGYNALNPSDNVLKFALINQDSQVVALPANYTVTTTFTQNPYISTDLVVTFDPITGLGSLTISGAFTGRAYNNTITITLSKNGVPVGDLEFIITVPGSYYKGVENVAPYGYYAYASSTDPYGYGNWVAWTANN